MAKPSVEPHFDIDPNIVFQLGDELITDVVTALVELVKNCYDADGSYARIVVDTESSNPDPDTKFPDAKGYILIEDDGGGMNEETIQNGWLLISASPKRAMKLAGKMTGKKRTPLGDKGVGRLGTQRLGNNVEIVTRTKDTSSGLHVSFSWDTFRLVKKLSDVTAAIVPVSTDLKRGTRLVISGISDPATWTDPKSLDNLKVDLSKLISPYGEISDFTVTVSVNGNPIELAEIGTKVQRAASTNYTFQFDGDQLEIVGRAKMGLFRSQNIDAVEFHDIVECDHGASFLEFLRTQKETERFTVRKSKSADWFLEARQTLSVDDIPNLLRTKDAPKNPKVIDPGPFRGRIDAFDLSPTSLREQNVFDAGKQFRDYVNTLRGVRVYRDGFGVKVDEDWLGLGEAWTSGGSYYGLKPSNTMGYVAISARDNSGLVETTDRESFKHTPEYDNFYSILKEVVKFTSELQETLRRGFVAYRKERHRSEAGVTPDVTAEAIATRITDRLSKAKKQRTAIKEIGHSLEAADLKAQITFEKLSSVPGIGKAERGELEQFRKDAKAQIDEALSLIKLLDDNVRDLSELSDQGQVLAAELQGLKTRLADMYEMVGLGLTAEALSHEIHNIADRLAARARDALRHLDRAKQPDPKVTSFVEHVRTAVAALRKQLSHLAPSMRYVREQRESIEVASFVGKLVEYYNERFEGKGIAAEVKIAGDGDFTIDMNPGKLTQVIDNVVLNSQYWLEEDVAAGRVSMGKVVIEVDDPYIRVYDNGAGIHPSVEESLFEPFVTRKPQGVGRGLGLFIVRQLLDSEGCFISLLPARNEKRRRYIFQFDMSGGKSHG